MKTGSILTILAAVAAVVVAAVVASGGGGGSGGGAKSGSTAHTQAVDPAGAQQLSFVVVSPEKEQLLKAVWGRLLNLRADQPFVANDNPSIVRTPLVIAMWEPMA